jgi:hypothetical protein
MEHGEGFAFGLVPDRDGFLHSVQVDRMCGCMSIFQ